MNKNQFENIIIDPDGMNYVQDLPLLKELIESFPYFQASYPLLTRLLFREKSIYTEKYIKLSAAYTGDREILYNYLYEKETQAPTTSYVDSATYAESGESIIEDISFPYKPES